MLKGLRARLSLGVVLLFVFCTESTAGLPPSSWYFGSSFNRIVPDSERNASSESGPRYHIGRTLGSIFALDLAYQKSDFSLSGPARSLEQTTYNLSLRRFFKWDSDEFFLSLEGGQTNSRLDNVNHTSPTYGLGLGYQKTAWEDGPAVAADIRYLVDLDEKVDPTIKHFSDWLIAITVIIPFYTDEPKQTPDRPQFGDFQNKNKKKISLDGTYSNASNATVSPVDQKLPQTTDVKSTNEQGSAGGEDKSLTDVDKAAQDETSVEAVKPALPSTTLTIPTAPTATPPLVVPAPGDPLPTPEPQSTPPSTPQSTVQPAEQTVEKSATPTSAPPIKEKVVPDTKTTPAESPTADFSKLIEAARKSGSAAGAAGTTLKSVSGGSDGNTSPTTSADDRKGKNVTEAKDKCNKTPAGAPTNSPDCTNDTDGDSVADFKDQCPGTPKGVRVNSRGCGYDGDGDGVENYRDRCKYTQGDVAVDAFGCELDSDKDGIVDSKDECPDSPPGIPVLSTGCS